MLKKKYKKWETNKHIARTTVIPEINSTCVGYAYALLNLCGEDDCSYLQDNLKTEYCTDCYKYKKKNKEVYIKISGIKEYQLDFSDLDNEERYTEWDF